jgi:hypothetical protein
MGHEKIRLKLHKWTDGQRTEEVIEAPDRWSVHEAGTLGFAMYIGITFSALFLIGCCSGGDR